MPVPALGGCGCWVPARCWVPVFLLVCGCWVSGSGCPSVCVLGVCGFLCGVGSALKAGAAGVSAPTWSRCQAVSPQARGVTASAGVSAGLAALWAAGCWGRGCQGTGVVGHGRVPVHPWCRMAVAGAAGGWVGVAPGRGSGYLRQRGGCAPWARVSGSRQVPRRVSPGVRAGCRVPVSQQVSAYVSP